MPILFLLPMNRLSKKTYLIIFAFSLLGIAFLLPKLFAKLKLAKQPQHPDGCDVFSIGIVCFDADNRDSVIAGGTSSENMDSSVYKIEKSGTPERHIYSWSEGKRSFEVAWRPSDPTNMRLITYCLGKEIRNEQRIGSYLDEDATWKLENPERQYLDCPAAQPDSRS